MVSEHEEDLKAVLVGCGSMSAAWLDAAREIPGLEIAGLVDVIESAARRRAAEYGLSHAVIGCDLAQVLEAIHPDMVFDCTIPQAHIGVTLEALRRGCHVLGEKPLADTMDNACQMVEAAQEAGKRFAVIQNRRYQPEIRRLRRFVDTGVMGRLTTVNSDFYLAPHFGGFRDQMQHPLLLDMAIHTFDAARFLTGADALSVYCHEWNPAGSWYAQGASAVAIFEMTGGVVYTYRGSWCAEGLPTSWEGEWRLMGETGTATWDGAARLEAQGVARSDGMQFEFAPLEVPTEVSPDKVGGHLGLIREFVHCVRTGAIPETDCTDNIKSLAMVFGAIESAQSGRRIRIAELEGTQS